MAPTGAALPIAVTMGEPAGIGLDTTITAWHRRAQSRIPPFVIWANATALRVRADQLGIPLALAVIETEKEAFQVFDTALPVVDLRLAADVEPGCPDQRNAPSVIAAIECAVRSAREGRSLAVMTNPIAKSVLYDSGFAFPGHTEHLAHLAREANGAAPEAVMMLASAELRVVLVTVHVPLANVPAMITRKRLLAVIEATKAALRNDFGIASPRIAVAGLNPHAGEDGTIGTEEQHIIAPVIEELAARGFDVTGPHPADTLFHTAARQSYDAVVAMYHDQALAPFKALSFDSGVNVTLGLPFVRTSPDHGTAFDLAGTGQASERSFVESLRLASEIAGRRRDNR